MSKKYDFVPYTREFVSEKDMLIRSEEYYQWLNGRRTVRDFSDQAINKKVIENIILSASAAPSGAHKQPWTFCAVSNSAIKQKIREEAEREEYLSYHGRMTTEWLEDLEPLGTDWHKPFLETAPWLIVVFKRIYETFENKKKNNYYVPESVGLATGFLLTAIHHAGLVALTHTPSPMNFLSKILKRPENERAFLLIPVGFPSVDAKVPNLVRKPMNEIAEFYI